MKWSRGPLVSCTCRLTARADRQHAHDNTHRDSTVTVHPRWPSTYVQPDHATVVLCAVSISMKKSAISPIALELAHGAALLCSPLSLVALLTMASHHRAASMSRHPEPLSSTAQVSSSIRYPVRERSQPHRCIPRPFTEFFPSATMAPSVTAFTGHPPTQLTSPPKPRQ
jgi:hypothetical protein